MRETTTSIDGGGGGGASATRALLFVAGALIGVLVTGTLMLQQLQTEQNAQKAMLDLSRSVSTLSATNREAVQFGTGGAAGAAGGVAGGASTAGGAQGAAHAHHASAAAAGTSAGAANAGASAAAPPSTAAPAAVTSMIQNFAFSPSVLKVRVGTTVSWMQMDTVQHSVVIQGAGSGPLMPKGSRFSHTFTQPGTFKVNCGPHPNMVQTVVVSA